MIDWVIGGLLFLIFIVAFNTLLPHPKFFLPLTQQNREAFLALGLVAIILIVIYSGRFRFVQYGDLAAQLSNLQADVKQIYDAYITESFSQKRNFDRLKFFKRRDQNLVEIRLREKPIPNSILYWEGTVFRPPDFLVEVNGKVVILITVFDGSNIQDTSLTIRYMKAPS